VVEFGEFGDRDDIQITLVVSAILMIFLGGALLVFTISDQLSSGSYSSLGGFLGLLLTGIGIIALIATIQWIRKAKEDKASELASDGDEEPVSSERPSIDHSWRNWYCLDCGMENPADNVLCRKCGQKKGY
jgi:hypothetical protein